MDLIKLHIFKHEFVCFHQSTLSLGARRPWSSLQTCFTLVLHQVLTHPKQCSLFTAYTVNNVLCKQCTLQTVYTVCSVHCAHCTVHCMLHPTIHCGTKSYYIQAHNDRSALFQRYLSQPTVQKTVIIKKCTLHMWGKALAIKLGELALF